MRRLSLFVVLSFALAAGSAAAQSAPAEMTINDSFSGTALHSDNVTGGTYIDNSLPGGNFCVAANVAANGFSTIAGDYNPIIYPADCDAALVSAGLPDQIRTWTLTLGDPTACTTLGFAPGTTSCSITLGEGTFPDKIIAGSLFSHNSTTTLVLVEFQYPAYSGNLYRVETNFPAATSGSGDTRTATYSRDATLYHPSSTGTPTKIGSSFKFPFQFTVQKF